MNARSHEWATGTDQHHQDTTPSALSLSVQLTTQSFIKKKKQKSWLHSNFPGVSSQHTLTKCFYVTSLRTVIPSKSQTMDCTPPPPQLMVGKCKGKGGEAEFNDAYLTADTLQLLIKGVLRSGQRFITGHKFIQSHSKGGKAAGQSLTTRGSLACEHEEPGR